MSREKREYECKILVIGPSKSGRTSLINGYVDNHYGNNLSTEPPMLAEFGLPQIKETKINDLTVKNKIWDVKNSDNSSMYGDVDAIIVTVEVTDENPTATLKSIIDDIKKKANKNVIVAIALTKSEQPELVSSITVARIEHMIGSNHIFPVSSKNGSNVEGLFESVSRRYLSNKDIKNEENTLKTSLAVQPKPTGANKEDTHLQASLADQKMSAENLSTFDQANKITTKSNSSSTVTRQEDKATKPLSKQRTVVESRTTEVVSKQAWNQESVSPVDTLTKRVEMVSSVNPYINHKSSDDVEARRNQNASPITGQNLDVEVDHNQYTSIDMANENRSRENLLNLQNEHECKILVIGPPKSGKTHLINGYINGSWQDTHSEPSIYARFGLPDKKETKIDDFTVENQIWDVSNLDDLSMYNKVNVIIITVDLTDKDALNELKSNLQKIKDHVNANVIVTIAVTKRDTQGVAQKAISFADFSSACENYGKELNIYCSVHAVSSITGEGVEPLFQKSLEYFWKLTHTKKLPTRQAKLANQAVSSENLSKPGVSDEKDRRKPTSLVNETVDLNSENPQFDEVYNIAIKSNNFEELRNEFLQRLPFFDSARRNGIPVKVGTLLALEGKDDKVEWMRQIGSDVSYWDVSSIALGYALAENHEKVETYRTQYLASDHYLTIVSSIAMGYALAGNHEEAEAYRDQHGANVNSIAYGYAIAANQEQVEFYCTQHHANYVFIDVAHIYELSGNSPDKVKAYINQKRSVNVEANRTQSNASVSAIANGNAIAGNHDQVEAANQEVSVIEDTHLQASLLAAVQATTFEPLENCSLADTLVARFEYIMGDSNRTLASADKAVISENFSKSRDTYDQDTRPQASLSKLTISTNNDVGAKQPLENSCSGWRLNPLPQKPSTENSSPSQQQLKEEQQPQQQVPQQTLHSQPLQANSDSNPDSREEKEVKTRHNKNPGKEHDKKHKLQADERTEKSKSGNNNNSSARKLALLNNPNGNPDPDNISNNEKKGKTREPRVLLPLTISEQLQALVRAYRTNRDNNPKDTYKLDGIGPNVLQFGKAEKLNASFDVNYALRHTHGYINRKCRKAINDGELHNTINNFLIDINNQPGLARELENDPSSNRNFASVDELISFLNKRDPVNTLIKLLQTYSEARAKKEKTYHNGEALQFTREDKVTASNNYVRLLLNDPTLTLAELDSLTNGPDYKAATQGSLGKLIHEYIEKAGEELMAELNHKQRMNGSITRMSNLSDLVPGLRSSIENASIIPNPFGA